jgi:hypothetical protein
VQYVAVDEQGQPTGDVVGNSSVRLDAEGNVVEMISE